MLLAAFRAYHNPPPLIYGEVWQRAMNQVDGVSFELALLSILIEKAAIRGPAVARQQYDNLGHLLFLRAELPLEARRELLLAQTEFRIRCRETVPVGYPGVAVALARDSQGLTGLQELYWRSINEVRINGRRQATLAPNKWGGLLRPHCIFALPSAGEHEVVVAAELIHADRSIGSGAFPGGVAVEIEETFTVRVVDQPCEELIVLRRDRELDNAMLSAARLSGVHLYTADPGASEFLNLTGAYLHYDSVPMVSIAARIFVVVDDVWYETRPTVRYAAEIDSVHLRPPMFSPWPFVPPSRPAGEWPQTCTVYVVPDRDLAYWAAGVSEIWGGILCFRDVPMWRGPGNPPSVKPEIIDRLPAGVELPSIRRLMWVATLTNRVDERLEPFLGALKAATDDGVDAQITELLQVLSKLPPD